MYLGRMYVNSQWRKGDLINLVTYGRRKYYYRATEGLVSRTIKEQPTPLYNPNFYHISSRIYNLYVRRYDSYP